ncbi:uncharacterized protein LOC122021011 [Zingiber officinale]|uniref:uncharacterized protein LOC122021011 n=1 Tax=Zingiber officinale TaxID=94328 RepID=UPI001C4D147F|nr:uncharacterized protein LOC122021011 [Zingiber officinale]
MPSPPSPSCRRSGRPGESRRRPWAEPQPLAPPPQASSTASPLVAIVNNVAPLRFLTHARSHAAHHRRRPNHPAPAVASLPCAFGSSPATSRRQWGCAGEPISPLPFHMMPLYHQHPDSLPQLATRALQTPHTTGLLNSFGSFPHRRSISPDLCSVLPHNRAGSLLGVIVRSGQCHPITVLSSTLAHYYGGISILFERNLWISEHFSQLVVSHFHD